LIWTIPSGFLKNVSYGFKKLENADTHEDYIASRIILGYKLTKELLTDDRNTFVTVIMEIFLI